MQAENLFEYSKDERTSARTGTRVFAEGTRRSTFPLSLSLSLDGITFLAFVKHAARGVRLVLFNPSVEGKELSAMRMPAPDGEYDNIERPRLAFLAVT
jgi:hypothetical protein